MVTIEVWNDQYWIMFVCLLYLIATYTVYKNTLYGPINNEMNSNLFQPSWYLDHGGDFNRFLSHSEQMVTTKIWHDQDWIPVCMFSLFWQPNTLYQNTLYGPINDEMNANLFKPSWYIYHMGPFTSFFVTFEEKWFKVRSDTTKICPCLNVYFIWWPHTLFTRRLSMGQ